MATVQSLEKLETLQKVVEFLGNWQERAKKESLVTTFFQMLTMGKRTAARTVLDTIAQRADRSPWRQGYINALEGMIAASETKRDLNLFINREWIETNREVMRKFMQQSKNPLHTEFDRGYFAAWADYIKALK